MTLSEAKTEELLRDARQGDQAALASLIGSVRDRVFRWALVMTGDTDDAEDVTQQTLIAVHRKLGDFHGHARFTTWLYTIVRNTALNTMGSAARRHEKNVTAEEMPQRLSNDVEEHIEQMDNRRAAALARSFFAELPSRQRELIELIDREGYNTVEAAEIMGVEPETARVHLLRARRTIRAKMLEHHPEIVT